MLRFRTSAWFAFALGATLVGVAADSSDALACGACFHPPPPPAEVDGTVVTDHRMAFAISPSQTVLWDQIRYSGSPSDFAWVLPVRAGARIELSQDAWLAALDASTQTVITGPVPSCGGGAPVQYENGGGGGCGGSTSNTASFSGASDNAGPAMTTPQVQVISQQVVGPYDAVTVRSSQGEALGTWLRANGYDIPQAFQPTIDAYTAQGFDFIALRLQPGVGVQAMQPVRVVTPGADPSLPLRMVAAGVGAHVGFELYVLSEGRYHTQNFPDATIDFSQLKWDPYNNVSTYSTLVQQALAANGGAGWLTEFAGSADLGSFSTGYNLPLSVAYSTQCIPAPMICSPAQPPTEGSDAADDSPVPSGSDAADGGGEGAAAGDGALAMETSAGDAGFSDAAAIDSGATPAGDGGQGGSGMVPPPTCSAAVVCDDLDLAMTGIATGNLWVTRLRADFPAAALATDLVLEATPSQAPVTNVHAATQYTDPKYSPCASNGASTAPGSSGSCACRTASASPPRHSDAIVASLGLGALALGMRRRRRR
jgi:MYXO-CTERM domain-containing protein